jgi:hypothetical protein
VVKTRLCQLYPAMNNKKKWKPAMSDELYEVQQNLKGKDLVGKRHKETGKPENTIENLVR